MKVSYRALLIGGTHLGPLRAALGRPDAAGSPTFECLSIAFVELDAKHRGAPAAFQVPPGHDIAVLFLNNPLWPEARIEPSFDLLMQSIDGEALSPGTELVPLSLMRRHVADVTAASAGPALRSLAAAQGPKRICVGPPAPEAPVAGQSEADRRAASLRLKLWFLLQQELAAFCGKSGIDFIGNPHGSRTPAGFLRQTCAGRENAAYGQLVMAQIVRAASKARLELPELLSTSIPAA